MNDFRQGCINRSADDAAGLAVGENIRGKTRGLNQAKRNASDAISMIQIAAGATNEMTNILIRLRELTVSSCIDNIGDLSADFLTVNSQLSFDEMDRIAKTAEYNGLSFRSQRAKTRYPGWSERHTSLKTTQTQ